MEFEGVDGQAGKQGKVHDIVVCTVPPRPIEAGLTLRDCFAGLEVE